MENYEPIWTSISFISVFLYIFSLFKGWAWNNYFTISLMLGVQFFFWIARQKEHLYLTKNSVSYSFLFYKKTIFPKEFKYQPSIIYDYKGRGDDQEVELLILKSADKVMSISDVKWKEDYPEIEKFIIKNYKENTHLKNPFLVRLCKGSSLLMFFCLLGISMIIFGIGLLSENLKSSYVSEMKFVNSEIVSQPKVVKNRGRGKPTYSLEFHLKDFPDHRFILQYRGFKRINGHKFAEQNLVGKEIGFFVDKGEYDHEILDKYSYRYFTSHVEHPKTLIIAGIFFDGTHIIDAGNYSKKVENNQHATSIAFLIFGGAFLGISLYGSKISYQ